MIQDALNEFAKEVYQNAVEHGFHGDDANRSAVANYAIWCSNLHGEVSELWEATRKGNLEIL